MNSAPPHCATGGCGSPLASVLPIAARFVLGGLFAFSASTKFTDPLKFALGIRGFNLGLTEPLIGVLTYAIPWAELIAAVLLVVGLWARQAAILIITLMLAFIGGIASLMARGMAVDCPCFGAFKVICTSNVLGTCHILRNLAFAAAAAVVVVMGAGPLSVDRLLSCRRVAQSGTGR